MANSKKPEQRSLASSKKAQPTGEEVYKATASSDEGTSPDTAEAQAAQTSGGPSYEELGRIAADLKQQVTRLYATGLPYTEERATPLIGVSFVVGLVIGMISGRS